MRQFEVHTIVNPGDSAGAKKLKKRLKADLEYYAVDERQQQKAMDGLRTVCRAGHSGDWTAMFHSDRAGESEDLSMPGQRMLNARSGEDVTGEKEETSESRYAHLFDTSGPNASHSRTVAESSMRSGRVEARVEPPSFPQPAHSSRVPDPLVPSTLLGHPVDEALEKQYRDLVQSYSPYMQEHLSRMLSSNYSEQAPVRLPRTDDGTLVDLVANIKNAEDLVSRQVRDAPAPPPLGYMTDDGTLVVRESDVLANIKDIEDYAVREGVRYLIFQGNESNETRRIIGDWTVEMRTRHGISVCCEDM